MGDDWIKRIVKEKRKAKEEAAANKGADEKRRQVIEREADPFWRKLVAGIDSAVKKYNAEVDADDRVGDLERPDSERFTVHKPKYPTGTLSVVLDKEQEEIVVSYSFTSAGGEGSKVSSQTAKFPILVEGGRLLLGQNEGERIGPPPERMIKWDLRGEGGMGIEDAVREILAPFFNGI